MSVYLSVCVVFIFICVLFDVNLPSDLPLANICLYFSFFLFFPFFLQSQRPGQVALHEMKISQMVSAISQRLEMPTTTTATTMEAYMKELALWAPPPSPLLERHAARLFMYLRAAAAIVNQLGLGSFASFFF